MYPSANLKRSEDEVSNYLTQMWSMQLRRLFICKNISGTCNKESGLNLDENHTQISYSTKSPSSPGPEAVKLAALCACAVPGRGSSLA